MLIGLSAIEGGGEPMARRRELENVADGMTDHMIGPFDDTIYYAEQLIRSMKTSEVRIDLLTGGASLNEMSAYGSNWNQNFIRHLGARGISLEWIRDAELSVSVAEVGTTEVLIRCRVAITDDRDVAHTSTRRHAISPEPEFRQRGRGPRRPAAHYR